MRHTYTHIRKCLAAILVLAVSLFVSVADVNAQHILNNGRLRFGNGSEQSINSTGNLQQPFYYNAAQNTFYKLTFSNYPLDNAYALGGDGSSEWNINGSISTNPGLSSQVIDASGFVATSGNSGYGTIVSTGNITVGSQMIEVRNTYVLGATAGFIRVTTRLRNVSSALMQNVRYWIGTRDDWVGNSDVTLKQRGNLTNGSFVQNSSTTQRALALKISTGSEGVLFYTAHAKANVIVHPNFGDFYSRIVQSNPSASSVNVSSDGSYGMYVRMNDLAVGATDELTWYYAAGDVASFNDIINEVATASGAVQNITYTTADLNATTSVNSTGYWMVVPANSAAPSAAQIAAGANYGSVTKAASGSGAMTANTQRTFNMTGLNPGTSYVVYFVSQDAQNAFSTVTSVPFSTTACPNATITASGATTFCQGGSVTLTANSGDSYQWSNGATSRSITVSQGGTYTVTVTLGSACSASASATVTVNALPTVTVSASGATTFCPSGSVTLTASGAGSYSWSTGASSASITVSQSGTFTVTGSTSGCTSSAVSTVVSVQDNIAPVIACPFDITVNAAAGQCGANVTYDQPSATDNCGSGTLPTSLSGYTYKGTYGGHTYFISNTATTPEAAHAAAIALGGHLVTINSAGENAFVSAMSSQFIWIGFTDRDIEGTFRWVTSEPVTYTNWNGGEPNNAGNEDWAVINWGPNGTWNDWTYSSNALYVIEFEGGSIPTNLVSGPASGSFFPVGTTQVTYNATDASGNTATCSFNVTVVDNQQPTISCPSNKVLTACTTTIGDYRSEATAADNCGTVTVSQSPAPGTAIAAGSTVSVTLTAIDSKGLSRSCSFTVNRPVYTATIAASGSTSICQGQSVTLTASAGASYNWSNGAMTQSITVNQAGSYSATVTNTDGCSATSAPASVTVNPLPVINITASGSTTICAGQSVTLDAGAGFSNYLWSNGATSRTISVSTAGNYSVSVTDVNGCTNSTGGGASTLYAVSGSGRAPSYLYTLNPANGAVISTIGYTGYVDITAIAVHPVTGEIFAHANSGGTLLKLDRTTGAATVVGITGIQSPDMTFSPSGVLYAWNERNDGLWTINTSTGAVTSVGTYCYWCTARTGLDYTSSGKLYVKSYGSIVELNPANGEAISTVNFSGGTHNLLASDGSNVLYTGERNGSNFILKTIDPATGALITKGTAAVSNISAIAFGGGGGVTVTVNSAPAITCPANVSATAAAGQCGAVVNYAAATVSGTPAPSVTYSHPSGSFFNVGTTTVTVTATNSCGTATCSFTVTVSDTQRPVISHNGNTNISTAPGLCSASPIISASASDNCGVGSPVGVRNDGLALTAPYPVGSTTITWNVTDVNGNDALPVTQMVVVTDNEAPTVITRPVTVSLDENGIASITSQQVDNGSNDACGIRSMTVSPSSFTCANVGDNTVTLTVTDNNGNVSTATATVTVEDKVAPVAIAHGLTVQLNAAGAVSITAQQVDNGSNDACGIRSLSVTPSSFTCANVGDNTVTLTVTDNNGNVSTATATVTVEDKIAPVAIAKNITVELSAAGAVSITAQQVNDGSNDACGISSMSVSPSSFTCDNVGANIVTLTVTDNNGNVSTATAIVSVEDNIAPVISCPGNFNVFVNNEGCTYQVQADEFNASAADACGVASYTYVLSGATTGSVNSLTGVAFNKGVTTVTVTATDVNGNTSVSCNFTVAVTTTVAAYISSSNVLPGGTHSNTIYVGYTPASTLTLQANPSGGGGGYTYNWTVSSNLQIVGAANAQTVQVTTNTPGSTSAYVVSLVVTDVYGCTVSAQNWNVSVIDVRCGNKNDKVLVCQKTGSAKNPWVQICIAPAAVAAHLANGSTLGNCPTVSARSSEVPVAVVKSAAIKAYPNPTTGVFELQLQNYQQGKIEIQVVDAYGKLIVQQSVIVSSAVENFTLDVRRHASGIYNVRVVSENEVKTLKVVVAK